MIYDTLNVFVENYLENDKTGRAIMLTSDWGTGKSYYVKKVLKPFLERNKKHKCIIVSLYGLTELAEISKSVYFELRTIGKSKDTEAANTGKVVAKIVGKTLLNGLSSMIGFDIAQNDDFQEVYESIDLSGKLVVFEDVERTKINLIDLLGYVNNLCEQDGVKVLLVTNESELIETIEIADDEGNVQGEEYTEDTILYLKSKEKTIGDTIRFTCDYSEATNSIISSFNDVDLSQIVIQDDEDEIRMHLNRPLFHNLRAFIIACQKTCDIYKAIRENNIDVSEEVKRVIFYGLMGFTQMINEGDIPTYPREQYVSADLGADYGYPLFRFCYDYIIFQKLDLNEIRSANKAYMDYYLNNMWSRGRDSDLNVIKLFYKHCEKEVIDAINNVKCKLLENRIGYYDYGVIVNYLIYLKYEVYLEFNLQEIQDLIISKLRDAECEIEFEELFVSGCTLENEEAFNEFVSFKDKVKQALENRNKTFDYLPSQLQEHYKRLMRTSSEDLLVHGFACKLNQERLISLLKECSAEQLDSARGIMTHLYRDSHAQVLAEDVEALREIRNKIDILLSFENYDNIQKWMVRSIILILDDILTRLSQ